MTTPRGRWTPRRAIAAAWALIALPLIAIVLALGVGAIVILSSELILGGSFDPFLPVTAYRALIVGAFGSFDAIVDTLVATSPLIFGGLAVATAFKAGLFNIGAQGQFLVGALRRHPHIGWVLVRSAGRGPATSFIRIRATTGSTRC